MVGSPHEALHRIFHEDTSLFTRTFQRLFDVALPEPHTVSVVNPEATEIRPLERRMDTVLLAEGEVGDQIVIIESQPDQDQSKLLSWPYYIAFLHETYQCPVTLLVISSKLSTAKWARQPIQIGPARRPCMLVHPFVLGPDNVPAITDLAEAKDDVVFTVLSALTHARSPRAAAILEVLAAALDTIDTDDATLLAEFTEVGLGNTTTRQVWRSLMAAPSYLFQSEFANQLRAEGEAKAVLLVLDERGIHVPPATRDQILACADPAVAEGWVARAVTATSVEDLFG